MDAHRRFTAIIVSSALVTLIVATTAFAGPAASQQAEQQQQHRQQAQLQQHQEQQQQAEQQERQAAEAKQEAREEAERRGFYWFGPDEGSFHFEFADDAAFGVLQGAEDNFRRAFELAQEYRARPRLQMGGPGVWSARSSIAHRLLAAADELELTEAQQTSIRELQRAHRREAIRRDADIAIAELELEEVMEADTPDLASVESQMRQIANLQVDGRIAGLRLERDVKAILTPEQLDKVEKMSPRRLVFERYARERNR